MSIGIKRVRKPGVYFSHLAKYWFCRKGEVAITLKVKEIERHSWLQGAIREIKRTFPEGVLYNYEIEIHDGMGLYTHV